MENEINGVKIQRLPTMGRPMSIKTRKQGRTTCLDSLKDWNPSFQKKKKKRRIKLADIFRAIKNLEFYAEPNQLAFVHSVESQFRHGKIITQKQITVLIRIRTSLQIKKKKSLSDVKDSHKEKPLS